MLALAGAAGRADSVRADKVLADNLGPLEKGPMRNAMFFLVVALLLVPLTVRAQVGNPSAPAADARVVLEIQVDGRSPATIHEPDGGLARITPAEHPTVGLMPIYREGTLQVAIFEVATDPTTGVPVLRQVGSHELTRGVRARLLEVEPSIDVTWTDILVSGTGTPEPNGPCLTCCVTCGDVTYCGCVVIASRGRCRCPAACVCPFEPTEQPAPLVPPTVCLVRSPGQPR
jgi:hypothetical protein